jgi:hypothetical protein
VASTQGLGGKNTGFTGTTNIVVNNGGSFLVTADEAIATNTDIELNGSTLAFGAAGYDFSSGIDSSSFVGDAFQIQGGFYDQQILAVPEPGTCMTTVPPCSWAPESTTSGREVAINWSANNRKSSLRADF